MGGEPPCLVPAPPGRPSRGRTTGHVEHIPGHTHGPSGAGRRDQFEGSRRGSSQPSRPSASASRGGASRPAWPAVDHRDPHDDRTDREFWSSEALEGYLGGVIMPTGAASPSASTGRGIPRRRLLLTGASAIALVARRPCPTVRGGGPDQLQTLLGARGQ